MTLPGGLNRRDVLMKIGILRMGSSLPFSPCRSSDICSLPLPMYEKARIRLRLSRPARSVSLRRNAPRHLSESGGESTDGDTAEIACWVRNVDGENFQVFAINCAHLGCPVRWFPQSSLFMCPCHGGAYYEDGSRASGPPERGLFQYHHRIDSGKLLIKTGEMPTPGQASNIVREIHPCCLIESIGEWLDARLQLGATIRETVEHPVPRESASWFYVFGSAAFVVFILQIVTGIMLALIYVPSAGEAWSSLQTLNHNVSLGWYIRALHGWGSDFMVAIVLIHMVQVFLFGAYKFPRELTWIVGVLLLIVTLGMAFTGQVLRFDQDAYWGLGIGASIASRVPVIGPWAVSLMSGGPIIAGATLSRFFALHVFVIPGLLIAFVSVHLLMVIKLGINEWPMPGRIVRKATYIQEYHALTKKEGVPFFPSAIWKDLFFAVPSFCFRLPRAQPTSVLLARRARPIPQSSRRRLARISFSCGSTPCFHFCRRRWKPPFYSSDP